MPDPLLRRVVERFFSLPSGAVDYVKYPCTIAGDRFAEKAAFRPLFGLRETLRSIRTR